MDPVCTLVFACIVLVTTLSVLKDSVRILVEGAPKNINFDKVREELTNVSNTFFSSIFYLCFLFSFIFYLMIMYPFIPFCCYRWQYMVVDSLIFILL